MISPGFHFIVILAATSAFSGSWSTYAGPLDTKATTRMWQSEIAMAKTPPSTESVGLSNKPLPTNDFEDDDFFSVDLSNEPLPTYDLEDDEDLFSLDSSAEPLPTYDFEVDEDLPVDFSSSYVKDIISAGDKLTNPSVDERALINSLRNKRSDALHLAIQCPVCFGSLHHDDTVTLICGDVMHERCVSGAKYCPTCRAKGPLLSFKQETFFTRALKQFELHGVIPKNYEPLRRNEQEESWRVVGFRVQNQFVETLRTIYFHVIEILELVLVDVHAQLSPSVSRLAVVRGFIRPVKRMNIDWALSNLKILVEQLHEPLTPDETSRHKVLHVPEDLSSSDEKVGYLGSLFNSFAKDFNIKIDAERNAVPNQDFLYRLLKGWKDWILKLQFLVGGATTLLSDEKRSELIRELFNKYISKLPYWKHQDPDIVLLQATFPFAKHTSAELARVLRNEK